MYVSVNSHPLPCGGQIWLERLAEGELPRDCGADVRDVVGPASLGDDLALAHLEVERSIVVAVVEKARHQARCRSGGCRGTPVPRGGNRAQPGRIGLTYEAEANNITSEEIISKIINKVEVP